MEKHRTFVTFGHSHHHTIGDQEINHNCVAVIESEGPKEGRARAFELFGPRFCFEYPEQYWDEAKMEYFPDGYVYI